MNRRAVGIFAVVSPMALMVEAMVHPGAGQPVPTIVRSNIAAPWTARAERRVMANPYDEVEVVQRRQRELKWANARLVKDLSERVSRAPDNPAAAIRNRAKTLSRNPSEIDPVALEDLLSSIPGGTDEGGNSAGGEWRDWLLPSISMLAEGYTFVDPPEREPLADWELVRDGRGGLIAGRVGYPSSRVRVKVGMMLDGWGRIMAARDTADAFFIVLENGTRIVGSPNGATSG